MNKNELASIITNKGIVIGDKIKLTDCDNNIREGILTKIEPRYKNLSIDIDAKNIKEFKIKQEFFHLNMDFKFIKDIEKIK